MFSCLHNNSVVKPPQTYWNTTRTIDRSTSPFTSTTIVRPSDKSESAAKDLATRLTNNKYVVQELASDAEGRLMLEVAIKMLLDRGIPCAGYLKINVEHGAREIWVD